MSTANSLAHQETNTSAEAPRQDPRAHQRCAHAVHSSRAKNLAVLTQEEASHNSAQLSYLQQSEGNVSPGRAPGTPGAHGHRQEERVGHVSQGQSRENRESLGMSYVTENISWPCRQFWMQSPSDMESTISAFLQQAARASWSRAVRMSAAPW